MSDSVVVTDSAPLITAICSEKLNDLTELTFSTTADSVEAGHIVEENYAVVKVADQWKEFIIDSVRDSDESELIKEVKASLSSVELQETLVETKITGSSPSLLLESILHGTRWSVGTVGNGIYDRNLSVDVQFMTVLEAIFTLQEAFNCDVHFSYTLDGNKIGKRQVNLYARLGADEGKRFEIDKDITSIEREIDTSQLATAIYPIKKVEEDGKTSITDISSLEWKKSAGKPVDKPKGQKIIANDAALKEWGRLGTDGKLRHRVKLYEFNDEQTLEQMAQMSWVNLGRFTSPKITYSINVVDLYSLLGAEYAHEKVVIGDTATVIDRHFSVPVVTKARVIEIERNLLDPTENEITLGDSLRSYSSDINKSRSNVQEALDAANIAKNNSSVALESANGKNTNYYGSVEPENPSEGDFWFRPDPDNPDKEQLVQWDGTQWVTLLDDVTFSEISDKINSLEEESKGIAEKADDAVSKATQAVTDAGFAKDTATTAQKQAIDAGNSALQAKQDAESAIKQAVDTAGKIGTVEGQLKTVSQTVDTVKGEVAQRLTATQVTELVNSKGYATQSSVNSQVSRIDGNINEHTSQLQSVNAKVDGISLGGRNLLKGTGDMSGNTAHALVDETETWNGNKSVKQTMTTGHYIDTFIARTTIFATQTEYTVSFWAKADRTVEFRNYFYSPYTTTYSRNSDGRVHDNSDGVSYLTATTEWKKYWITWTQTKTNQDKQVLLGRLENASATIWINSPMLVEGNKPMPWAPAPEDQATITELTSKTNTINQRISDAENSITAVVNTTSTQGGKITSLESKVSIVEGAVKTTNTKVDGNTTQIGNLQSSYSGLQSTVSAVQTDLSNLEIGGRNLIRNSGGNPQNTDQWVGDIEVRKHVFYKNGQENLFLISNSTSSEKVARTEWVKVKRNTEYTLSFYGFMGGNVKSADVYIMWKKTGSTNNTDGNKLIFSGKMSTSKVERKVLKIVTPAEADEIYIRFDNNGSNNSEAAWFMFGDITLVEGNKPIPWSPAWEDLTKITEFSDFQQSVKGFQTTVNGVVSGLQSQQTTLAGQISSVVRELGDLSVGNRNLIKNGGGNPSNTEYWSQSVTLGTHPFYKNGESRLFVLTASDSAEKTASSNWMSVKQGTKYTVKFSGFMSGNVHSYDIYIMYRKKENTTGGYDGHMRLIDEQRLSPSVLETKELTFTTPSGADYIYFRIDNNGSTDGRNASLYFVDVMVVEGTKAPADWMPAVEELAYESQVNQLSRQIDQRVTKGELIGQINTQAGKVLIRANDNVLMVTPSTTYIQNATIKDAMIESVTANKLTAGTLDAAKVNVVNLNANNIVAGTLTGIKIQGSEIVSNGENYRVQMVNGALNWYNESGKVAELLTPYDSWGNQGNLAIRLSGGRRFSVYTGVKTTSLYPLLGVQEFPPDGSRRALDSNVNVLSITSVTDNSKDYINLQMDKNYGTFGIAGNGRSYRLHFDSVSDRWEISGLNTRVKADGETIQLYGRSRTDVGSGGDLMGNGGMSFGKDDTGARVWSQSIYTRRYSTSANVCITNYGTLGRVTSARKYKADIQVATDVIANAKKILSINPVSWLDKAELASKGHSGRYFGFIADEFADLGMNEVVVYGQDGQVESLAYDRVPIYHNVILKDHESQLSHINTTLSDRLQDQLSLAAVVANLKEQVTQLQSELQQLQAA